MLGARASWLFPLASGAIFLWGCSDPLPTRYGEPSTGGNGNVTHGTGGAANGGGSSQAGTSSAGDGGIAPFGPLGLACSKDSDCSDGLVCLGAAGHTLGSYVPPGGFCTQACHTDGDCASSAGASCVQWLPNDTSSKYCSPPCELGDDTACGQREDVACWPLALFGGTSGRVCIPTCNSDEQCPDRTTCDGTYNLCVSGNPTVGGLPLNSECDLNQSPSPCDSGFCLELSAGSGVCTAYCRRGKFPQCTGDYERSACAWVNAGDEAAGLADIGMCALRCRCDSDCNNASLRCEARADLLGAYPGICTATSGPADTDCSK